MPEGVLTGVACGLAAGGVAGFLGVSPGGILVPVLALRLGLDEHLTQAVALIAQAPPSSLSGAWQFRQRLRHLFADALLLGLGFVLGGPLGAWLALGLTDVTLRWMFVAYLLLLAALTALGGRSGEKPPTPARRARSGWMLPIGIVAGLSSGLLGIGGGLAITVFGIVLARRERHDMQALSLLVTALPLTLPAALVYVRQGVALPWGLIAGVVIGLLLGTGGGARLARGMPAQHLGRYSLAFILALALLMAVSAWRHGAG